MGEPQPAQAPRLKSAFNGKILGLFLVFVMLAFARCWSNLPWVDEGWFFNPVHTLLTHGYAGTTVMESKGFPWEGIEGHQYWQPPLHLVEDAIWLKIFGLSLVAFRSLSLVAGVALLVSWLYLLRYWGASPRLQGLVMALIVTDYSVVRAGSDGRTDMMSAALGLAAIAIYLRFREEHFAAAILASQTLIASAGMTHPIGGILSLSYFTYFFLSNGDWRRLMVRHVALGALPYLAGAAAWAAYISQDPQLFKTIFMGSSVSGRMAGLTQPLIALQRELIFRYLTPFGWNGASLALKVKILIPITYLLGALCAWLIPGVRRNPVLRPFFAMWLICCISVFVFDNQKNGTYMVHLTPLYAILLAGLTDWCLRHKGVLSMAAPVCLAGFIALQTAGSLYLIWTNPYKTQYQPVIDYVTQHKKPGDRIVGTTELAFGLGFDTLRDDIALGYFVGKKPDIIVMNPRYRVWQEGERGKPIGDHVQKQLAEHRLTFETSAFQVYMPVVPSAGQ